MQAKIWTLVTSSFSCVVVYIVAAILTLNSCTPKLIRYRFAGEQYLQLAPRDTDLSPVYEAAFGCVSVRVSAVTYASVGIVRLYVGIQNDSCETVSYQVNKVMVKDVGGGYSLKGVWSNGKARSRDWDCNVPKGEHVVSLLTFYDYDKKRDRTGDSLDVELGKLFLANDKTEINIGGGTLYLEQSGHRGLKIFVYNDYRLRKTAQTGPAWAGALLQLSEEVSLRV